MTYDRWKAVSYAHKWAFERNPAYLDFSRIGGDCTNFVSQCLRAGGAAMNYSRPAGWFYSSAASRAPAWTSVQYLYQFLISNSGTGPYAREVELSELEPGDIVQLAFTQEQYSHSLLVVQTGEETKDPLAAVRIAAHSDDSDYRPLADYEGVVQRRYLQIRCR